MSQIYTVSLLSDIFNDFYVMYKKWEISKKVPDLSMFQSLK